jgi:hypothetical protein
MINKITFCLADKPESFSFDFDYYTLLDDGSITYNNITKHTGLSSNEFYNIENIFLNIDRFDLIVHRAYDLASIGASSTSIINNKIIYPEIINFDNTKADSQSIFKKIKSLTIKPITIWNLENDDVDFYKHLTSIRREIKLSRLGI